MKLIILTLIVILSIILCTQFIVLFVQYRGNRSFKGIGYWSLGSGLMGLGFFLMPLVSVNALVNLARIANPLLILGYIFLYIGIKRFFDKKIDIGKPISIFVVYNLFYYYYMFINDSVTARAVAISVTIAMVSFMIAYEFLLKKDKQLSSTTNFNAGVFFVYGCAYTIRAFFTIILPPVNSYIEPGYSLIYAIVFSIVMSNLWTFGLIIMVNQRLNIENQLEKEKLQLIFNTNINAQLITRLKDGFIVDVNDEFSVLSGYSRDEVIGKTTN